jgi:DNA-damage-inducible protein D
MPKKNEITIAGKSFEELKQVNDHGAEYWSARALQPMLGDSQWRRFEQAIERAIISCRESGNPSENHFAGAGKMVELGSGSVREVEDYQLSRFACYLIAQNGDPRKPEIARAQQYFAVQTRRQELSDQLAADVERLELRKQTSEEFKALSGAAQDAGVQSKMFGVFHDAGYKGLYGGLGRESIKQRKAIPEKDNLLDRMNATELEEQIERVMGATVGMYGDLQGIAGKSLQEIEGLELPALEAPVASCLYRSSRYRPRTMNRRRSCFRVHMSS